MTPTDMAAAARDAGGAPGRITAIDPPGHGLLAGKVVVVTAAAGSGIGYATARRCLLEGAAVMISDRNHKRLDAAREQLAGLDTGNVVEAAPCDVTSAEEVERLLAETERTVGPIDALVNNAGLGGSALLVEMTDDQWRSVLDVSLNGTFLCMRAGLRRMQRRRAGAIVNLASVTGWRPESEQTHYAAAKAGVMAMTRCAAVEAAPYNVRINTVAPTLAITEHMTKLVPADVLDGWAAVQPHGRAAQPFEVANVIAFLASDYASYMTGEVVSVGGLHP